MVRRGAALRAQHSGLPRQHSIKQPPLAAAAGSCAAVATAGSGGGAFTMGNRVPVDEAERVLSLQVRAMGVENMAGGSLWALSQ